MTESRSNKVSSLVSRSREDYGEAPFRLLAVKPMSARDINIYIYIYIYELRDRSVVLGRLFVPWYVFQHFIGLYVSLEFDLWCFVRRKGGEVEKHRRPT